MELIRLDIVITQIIGFLIVLWVLKRYAWGPVLGMLEERRNRIAREVGDAEKLRQDAERLKADYEQQLQTIESQARQRIQKAAGEGKKVAEEMRQAALDEARKITEKAKADLDREYQKARVELRGDIVNLALGAAERLLVEKVDTEEHRRLVDRFLTDLETREKAGS
jgi:F-type H+-transporting ATPase subunit b